MSDFDRRLSTLLEEATSDLMPDVEALVGRGVIRGRRRARRQRTATALGAAAALAVLTVTAASLVPVLAGHSDSPSPGVAAGTTQSKTIQPTTRRGLAVSAAQIPDVFGRMFSGDITKRAQKEPDVPIVDFLWNGFAVRVGIQGQDDVTGSGPTVARTPMERCRLDVLPRLQDSCVLAADGSAVRTLHATGPAVDGGITMNAAFVFTPDGWNVVVWAANAADTKDSPILAAAPPLTQKQLLRAAQSKIWFQ